MFLHLNLSKDHRAWYDNEVFITMRDCEINVKLGKSRAERETALIGRFYNGFVKQNEDQELCLLQAVSGHCQLILYLIDKNKHCEGNIFKDMIFWTISLYTQII